MVSITYQERRGQLETYFDRTAVEAWSRLTSDAPVGRIRATVRAGRDRMRQTLLQWLPEDLSGQSLLDAGCGTGALAVEAARRGARVVAVDLSPTLIELARARAPQDLGDLGDLGAGSLEFRVGDMLDPALGRFDHMVAMDSLIHYGAQDAVRVLKRMAARTDGSLLFTLAPATVPLMAMHTLGRLFPRGNRAPRIVPIRTRALSRRLRFAPDLTAWRLGRSERIVSGFYISQAMELRHV